MLLPACAHTCALPPGYRSLRIAPYRRCAAMLGVCFTPPPLFLAQGSHRKITGAYLRYTRCCPAPAHFAGVLLPGCLTHFTTYAFLLRTACHAARRYAITARTHRACRAAESCRTFWEWNNVAHLEYACCHLPAARHCEYCRCGPFASIAPFPAFLPPHTRVRALLWAPFSSGRRRASAADACLPWRHSAAGALAGGTPCRRRGRSHGDLVDDVADSTVLRTALGLRYRCFACCHAPAYRFARLLRPPVWKVPSHYLRAHGSNGGITRHAHTAWGCASPAPPYLSMARGITRVSILSFANNVRCLRRTRRASPGISRVAQALTRMLRAGRHNIL